MHGSPHDSIMRPHHPQRRPVFRPLGATRNGLRTAAVLAGLGGLLVAVGSIFGEGGAFVGLLLGVAVAAGSWWFSDRLALAAAGAVPAERWAYPDGLVLRVRGVPRDGQLPRDPQDGDRGRALATPRAPRRPRPRRAPRELPDDERRQARDLIRQN